MKYAAENISDLFTDIDKLDKELFKFSVTGILDIEVLNEIMHEGFAITGSDVNGASACVMCSLHKQTNVYRDCDDVINCSSYDRVLIGYRNGILDISEDSTRKHQIYFTKPYDELA